MMNKELLKKAQLIMLEELLELNRICKKYNIQYWITDGTLLGAIRHKGFIPWDDDVDVCMLKEDYRKFKEIAVKELDSKYFLQSIETDKAYNWFSDIKIRDRNSIFIEDVHNENEKFHQGINIDIFMMERYYNKINKIYKILLKIREIKISSKKNRYFFIKKLIIILKINKLCSKIINLFISKKKTDTLIGYKYTFPQLYKSTDIFPLSEIEFEGYKFPCPNNADAYLKELYGDTYMQLPLEKDRVWHAKEIRLNEKCFFEKELERTGRKLYED